MSYTQATRFQGQATSPRNRQPAVSHIPYAMILAGCLCRWGLVGCWLWLQRAPCTPYLRLCMAPRDWRTDKPRLCNHSLAMLSAGPAGARAPAHPPAHGLPQRLVPLLPAQHTPSAAVAAGSSSVWEQGHHITSPQAHQAPSRLPRLRARAEGEMGRAVAEGSVGVRGAAAGRGA